MFSRMIFTILLSTWACCALADTPRLNDREGNQEERIEQGVKSGELTKPEAHRLVRSERRLERLENSAQADGVVTGRERARLHNEADRTSTRIYRQKHDRQDRR